MFLLRMILSENRFPLFGIMRYFGLAGRGPPVRSRRLDRFLKFRVPLDSFLSLLSWRSRFVADPSS
jgi:hypothetical protein